MKEFETCLKEVLEYIEILRKNGFIEMAMSESDDPIGDIEDLFDEVGLGRVIKREDSNTIVLRESLTDESINTLKNEVRLMRL